MCKVWTNYYQQGTNRLVNSCNLNWVPNSKITLTEHPFNLKGVGGYGFLGNNIFCHFFLKALYALKILFLQEKNNVATTCRDKKFPIRWTTKREQIIDDPLWCKQLLSTMCDIGRQKYRESTFLTLEKNTPSTLNLLIGCSLRKYKINGLMFACYFCCIHMCNKCNLKTIQ